MATSEFAKSNSVYAASEVSQPGSNPSHIIFAVLMTLAGCAGIYFFLAVLFAVITR